MKQVAQAAANVIATVICTALIVGGVLGFAEFYNPAPDSVTALRRRMMTRPPDPFKPGDTLSWLSDDFRAGNHATVLLVLTTRCPFCAGSMPFYRRLSELPGMDGIAGRLVVLTPDHPDSMKAYLSRYHLTVHSIIHIDMGVVTQIKATPTLIILDGARRVLSCRSGQLDQAGEREVENVL